MAKSPEGHAAREKREHGEGGGERSATAFRPVENQLMLLRGEMRAFKADLKSKNAKT